MINWFRARGSTTPFSYRVYSQPAVQAPSPIISRPCSAHAIYCVPWLTGQGGGIDAMHARCNLSTASGVTAHWGIYTATHARFVVPGGLIAANSFNLVTNIMSVAMVCSVVPNAMHWLAFAANSNIAMRAVGVIDQLVPILGIATDGTNAWAGIVASWDVTNGLPATFPQQGWQLIGDANGVYPPFLGVHYS